MRETTRTTIIMTIMLISFVLVPGTPHTIARAQTVLSPTPFMPLQNRAKQALEIPSAAEDMDQEQADETADEKTCQIPLVFNDSVESQIDYFTTRGRAIFQAWLDRSARYLPIMKKIFREYNLPEDLVYVAMIESGFNPHAVSPKKAVGPWQFMKATAREYGLNTDHWVDERRDPIKSTRAAAAHFKNLYNIFGSWPMALASYNAGMGRMQGAVIKGRTDDFWELRSSRFMHAETQEYVPKYMAALIIAKDPVSYGFSDPEAEPFEYDEVTVQGGTELRKIAEYTGCSYDQIRDLNPELLMPKTPRAKYVLRIPRGSKKTYQQRVANNSAAGHKHPEKRRSVRLSGALFTRITDGAHELQPGRRPSGVVKYAAQLNLFDGKPAKSTP